MHGGARDGATAQKTVLRSQLSKLILAPELIDV
jgi:hypothetical protein